jgi:hypothetical protein
MTFQTKNHANIFSHSVLGLTHLFINTYTLRAVPEHAMGWGTMMRGEKRYDKLPTNQHYNKISTYIYVAKNKLTNKFFI